MRFPFRSVACLGALLAVGSVHAAAPTTGSSGAPAATSTIYQQRDADGRTVLTDRPSPLSVTERSWQSEREDPVAARQRAEAVRRQAEAVSVRVQQSIDRDRQARDDVDAEARQRARDDRDRDAALARADDEASPLLVAPFGVGGYARRSNRAGWSHDGRRGGHAAASRPDHRPSRATPPPTRTPRPWRGGLEPTDAPARR